MSSFSRQTWTEDAASVQMEEDIETVFHVVEFLLTVFCNDLEPLPPASDLFFDPNNKKKNKKKKNKDKNKDKQKGKSGKGFFGLKDKKDGEKEEKDDGDKKEKKRKEKTKTVDKMKAL